ncbi:MAG: SH3 domain-containing protein [Treponema sp.]|nr:SH3 domain-containing protein [Treponema sp.]MCL2236801.1 SH3 domain-containing protein [Treponema sp.]
MKNIYFTLLVISTLIACTPAVKNNSNANFSSDTEVIQNIAENTVINEPLLDQEILENMSIQDIISLLIEKKTIISIVDHSLTDKGFHPEIGYFEFISHNNINWYRDTSGFRFFPYLYIVDDENIRVEVFYYFIGGGRVQSSAKVTSGKYYIYITKNDLIARYFRRNNRIENYISVKTFETIKYQPETLSFKVLSDTDVYAFGSMQGQRTNRIIRGTDVEINDIYYINLNDDLPTSVQINTGNITGWININNVNFVDTGTNTVPPVNGILLHNTVNEILLNFGPRSVDGKITGDTIPIRSLPANNSERLFQLGNNTVVHILEVSANREIINGIEAAWYKVSFLVPNEEKTDDRDVNGWVFGAFLEINETGYHF